MKKIAPALAIPAALFLALGLSACNDDSVPVASETQASEEATEDSGGSNGISDKTDDPSPTKGGQTSAPPSPTTKGRETSVQDLQVGDCIEAMDETSTSVFTVSVVDCSAPHAYEVYHEGNITASSFPSGDAMDTWVADICVDPFNTYVGVPYQSSIYEISYFTPTEGSWSSGDRVVSCMVTTSDGSTVSQSLKGANQ